MKRGRIVLIVVTMVVVLGAALAINGISARYSRASTTRDRVVALRAQANRKLGEIPDSYRADEQLVESATLATTDTAAIVTQATKIATSLGLTWVEPDKAVATSIHNELEASLQLAEAAGRPVLRLAVGVVAFQGDVHKITQLLETVNRGSTLLVMSPVEFRFTNNSVVATFALAGAVLVPKMPGQSLGVSGGSTTTTSPGTP